MASLSFFPEAEYVPNPWDLEKYEQAVRAGRERMKELRCVIMGLARDDANVMPKAQARLTCTARLFKEAQIFVYENDSVDATPELLRTWASRQKNVTVLTETRGDPENFSVRDLNRAGRMAFYRNKCRKYVLNHWADYDYVILIDVDVNGGWSYDGIANTFGHSDWDFVGSNGIIRHNYGDKQNYDVQYDVWAFRWYGDWSPRPGSEINPLVWPRGADMFPVYSCFGGLGIYRMEALRKAKYDGSDCEHIPFHRRMIAAGLNKLYLNPSQIVLY